jgi:hypothetical protein
MSVAESVIEKIQSLTPDQQREVMNLVDELAKSNTNKHRRRSLMGAFSHLNIHITEDDIADARREMWGKFPREAL